LRAGDTFHVLLEEKYLDGKFVRHGRVLAARFVNRGRSFWGFYFDGKVSAGGYFDREGRSLRKAFLKSPLKFTRITSTFTHSRFHPVLQIYRPHLGVDYAAPTGTPVRAVADGRVNYAGWEGGFGNMVKIQHNGTYTSMYGHLSRMASGIRTGASVRQGQLIGSVGSTGLATGPHLDFRLLKGGQFINPLKVNFINAEPVNNSEIAAFRKTVSQRIAEFEKGGPALAEAARAKTQ
jgi:murein DD-endopeptidase MepM/ murein hydrolase activator NlpD